MSDDVLFALFEPTEPRLLSTLPQAQLLVDNPLLATSLSSIFPYLLLIDNALEIATWTNEDPFSNFLIVASYSILVLYWQYLKFWLIPLLMALVFSSVVWNISSVLHDAKFDEKPTIGEVLSILHNITVRSSLILRPIKHLHMSVCNYLKLVVAAILFTPVHALMVRYIFSPQTELWAVGVIVLTYHSLFMFAIRRLLWRSAYLRRALYLLTGLNVRLTRGKCLSPTSRAREPMSRTHSPSVTDKENISGPLLDSVQAMSNFTILKKVVVSPTQLEQTIRYNILENERRWLGLGWSKYLLPNERASFCYEESMLSAPNPHSKEPFLFPVYENSVYTHQWSWLESKWSLDHEFNHNKHKSGWVYYDKTWGDLKFDDGFSRSTRTRKWTRRATLLIDKRAEVNDE